MTESMTKELKREKIIHTAAKEFAEKGFDKANINEIAILSGIGKGSIYIYFKTKKDLYLATLETVVSTFNESSSAILNSNNTAIKKMELCLKGLFELEEEGLPLLILWSRYQFQNNPVFQDEAFDIFENLQQPLCDIVYKGVEEKVFYTPHPEATGYLILSMICMLIPSLQPKPLLSELTIEEKVQYVIGFVKNALQYEN